MVVDGRPVSPEQAAENGIVDKVVDADELVEVAITEAKRLGARPKAAIGACKRAVYSGGSLPLEEGLLLERSEFLSGLGTEDAQRATGAYVDATARTGDLPVYDPAASADAFARGRFL
jgi:enoyl-CoA hydratase/carnithine racemase